MARRKVDSPDGRTWTIGRRWLPGRRRLGRADLSSSWPEWFDVGDDVVGIVLTLVLSIVGILLLLVLFNVVAIAIELLILVFAVLAGLFGRVVLRRPWIVEARTSGPPADAHAWKVVGWRRGRRVIEDVAAQLGAGEARPRPAEASGVQLDAPRRHR